MSVVVTLFLLMNGVQAMDLARAEAVRAVDSCNRDLDKCLSECFEAVVGGQSYLLKLCLTENASLVLQKERLLASYGGSRPRSLLFVAIYPDFAVKSNKKLSKSIDTSEEVVAVILDLAQSTRCLREIFNIKSCYSASQDVYMTPFELAVRLKKKDVVRMLVRAMVESFKLGLKQAQEAASGSFGEQLVRAFPNIQNVLTYAERKGDQEIEYFLRQLVACTTFEEAKLWVTTSLHQAAQYGRTDDLRRILSKIANNPSSINARDEKERTPAILAAINGHVGCLRLLLATQVVVVTVQDTFGMTALNYAECKGRFSRIYHHALYGEGLDRAKDAWHVPYDSVPYVACAQAIREYQSSTYCSLQ